MSNKKLLKEKDKKIKKIEKTPKNEKDEGKKEDEKTNKIPTPDDIKKIKKPKDYIIPQNPEILEIEILGALSKEPQFLVNNFIKKGLKKYATVQSALDAYKKLYKK